MPAITDTPPADVQAELSALAAHLDAGLPARTDGNFLIGTWNIRAFGGLTRVWRAGPDHSPKRDLTAARAIAEIVSRFDVIAVQEVKGDLRALRDMLKVLGPDWGFLMTDVTYGAAGNGERLAFLFDTRRVRPSGLAAELVVPEDLSTPFSSPANAFQRQFVRTPYAVSFVRGGKTVVLVTLHVVYGERGEDRAAELGAIARWLRAWAERTDDYGQNLICLGDFNIDREGDPQHQALTSTGLRPAPDHRGLPRTVFHRDDAPDTHKFYDQVAWFETVRGKPYLNLAYRGGGGVDFRGLVHADLTVSQMSYRISDHFPLWVEFGL